MGQCKAASYNTKRLPGNFRILSVISIAHVLSILVVNDVVVYEFWFIMPWVSHAEGFSAFHSYL